MKFWNCVFNEVHHAYTNLKDLVLAWEETLEFQNLKATKWPNL